MHEARVSIIIVNWNTKDLLQACLDSFIGTLPKDTYSVTVVDNGSTDESVEMLKNYPTIRLICNTENVGFAKANNQGFLKEADYQLLLNSDTVVHGDTIQRSVEFMEEHTDAAVMGCRVLNTDGTLQTSARSFPSLKGFVVQTTGLAKINWLKFLDTYEMPTWDRFDTRSVDVVSGCYMLVRQKSIEEIGYLDEDFFFFGEETDWCKRFKNANWKIMFAPVGTITHHGGGSVNSLLHEREILLGKALIKYHKKHHSLFTAAAVFTVCYFFSLSRALYWQFKSYFGNAKNARQRSRYHYKVLVNQHRIWS